MASTHDSMISAFFRACVDSIPGSKRTPALQTAIMDALSRSFAELNIRNDRLSPDWFKGAGRPDTQVTPEDLSGAVPEEVRPYIEGGIKRMGEAHVRKDWQGNLVVELL